MFRLLKAAVDDNSVELVQCALLAAREGSHEALRVLVELGGVDPDTRLDNQQTFSL